jgi:hypothetical protein
MPETRLILKAMVVILSSTFENPLLRWTEHELDIPDFLIRRMDSIWKTLSFVVEHHDEVVPAYRFPGELVGTS